MGRREQGGNAGPLAGLAERGTRLRPSRARPRPLVAAHPARPDPRAGAAQAAVPVLGRRSRGARARGRPDHHPGSRGRHAGARQPDRGERPAFRRSARTGPRRRGPQCRGADGDREERTRPPGAAAPVSGCHAGPVCGTPRRSLPTALASVLCYPHRPPGHAAVGRRDLRPTAGPGGDHHPARTAPAKDPRPETRVRRRDRRRLVPRWHRRPDPMPLLSAFLGHSGPEATYWYLEAAPVLLSQAAARLERDAPAARRPS
jgi:hypothetical protein